jgi:sugar transferase (PEP-CTERM system associated)
MEKIKIETGPEAGAIEPDVPGPAAKRKLRISFLKGKVRFLGHFIHVAFLLLAVAEIAVFAGASFAAVDLLYGGEQGGRPAIGVLLPEIVSTALILIFSMAAMGLHHARQREPLGGILLRIGVAFLLGVLLITAVNLLIPNLFTSKEHFLPLFVALSLAGLGILRIAFYKYVDGRIMKRQVLVMGTGEKANKFMRLRRKSDQRGFTVRGFVRLCTSSNVCVHSPQIVSPEEGLCKYALQNGIDEIVIALDDPQEELPEEELIECRMNGIEISDILHFFEREAGKILVDVVKPSWFIHSDGFRFNYLRGFTKRLFDVVASLFLLLLFVPVIAVTIFAIWIENGGKGPILYLQRRVGARGERFNVIKFRSMIADAEKDGAQWATKNDSRITRVGAVIRKFRIDEIPQLLNVLLGQMSLVGPRPERPEFVSELSEEIPYYNERHRVKPGLTGWAQSCYPYGSSAQDSVEKLQYDLFYVKNHSFLLDLFILLQTAEVVLFGKGAR